MQFYFIRHGQSTNNALWETTRSNKGRSEDPELSELGHLQVGDREAEQRASARARVERGLGWAAWADELNVVLAELHRLLWPDLFIVGGGVTENWASFGPLLTSRAEIVVARYGNDAGRVGAAMAAAEGKTGHPRFPATRRDGRPRGAKSGMSTRRRRT